LTHWPLDIVIASGGLPHDGATLAQRSLGGSETAAIMVAKSLAARGHHVTMFTPCQGGFFDGVVYMPLDTFAGYASSVPHDVTVVSRIMDFLKLPLQSAVRILWCHDLALKRQRGFLYGVLWSVDAVYLLSPFMVRQYREVYEGIPESIFYLTRNGIDVNAFAPLKFVARDRDKLVYGSRPERGLEQCLNIMDELARRHSTLRLEVACYDNVTPQMAPYYEVLWARARTMPNVKLLGSLRQADWHRQIASALAVMYPNCPGEFREISCLVAMEAQACGTPMVAARKGAIPDTLAADAGVFLGEEDTDPDSEAYITQFADTVMALREDEVATRRMAKAGLARAQELDWSEVARQWEGHWYELLAARVDDPQRVAAHFARIGELEAVA